MSKLRLGRIAFINVAPIYYALENNILNHNFELIADVPSHLNEMMCQGQLDLSACSCLEYARRWRRYYLAEDLCIASNGPVMSVLLLSQKPLTQLDGAEILISGQSHTSVILTQLLLKERMQVEATIRIGHVSMELAKGHEPCAFLAIGDEALKFAKHPKYPYVLDLAEAWHSWTGLPFVFAVWIISRQSYQAGHFQQDPSIPLRASRDYGLQHLDLCIDSVEKCTPLDRAALKIYYQQALNYKLGPEELKGLQLFYQKIANHGFISEVPELNFYPTK